MEVVLLKRERRLKGWCMLNSRWSFHSSVWPGATGRLEGSQQALCSHSGRR